jgi:signal transduction histidine kinase
VKRGHRALRAERSVWCADGPIVGARANAPPRILSQSPRTLAGTAVGLAAPEVARRAAEHELNNKLTATVGFAELLAHNPELPANLRPFAQEALRGASDCADLVNRLQHITHIEEKRWGAQQDGPTTIDLHRSTPAEPG